MEDANPYLCEPTLEEAFRHYYSFVRSIVYGWLRHGADADEIAQAVFIKLAARPEVLSGGSVKHWLARVARNAALDRLREKRQMTVPLSAVISALPSAETVCLDELSSVDLQLAAHLAIEALPIAQRQVVDLCYFGGLTHVQIAAETGIPLGTVKTRVRAALKKLRAALPARNS